MRRFLVTTCFGLFYLASILIVDCLGAGSPWQEGIPHALFIGTFFFVVSFPVILLLQAGLRLLARRLKLTPGKMFIWEFVPLVAVSLLFLSGLRGTPPESRIWQFIVDPLPPSVHDVHVWHRRYFNGGSVWALWFRIDPPDFDRILSRHPYEKAVFRRGDNMSELGTVISQRPDFPVPSPNEPMVVSYSYSELHSTGGTSIKIYANEQRDLVYVMGSYD